MVTGEDIHGMRKATDLSRWLSVVMLLLHFYYYCYDAMVYWGFTAALPDRILGNISRTGLFSSGVKSLLMALAFLTLSLFGAKGRKTATIGYSRGLIYIVMGLSLYFGPGIFLSGEWDLITRAWLYMGMCSVGYLLILSGGMRLSRVIGYSLRKEFFGGGEGGFQQQEKEISTDFSINLSTRYQWRGKTRKGFINIINARRGVLLIGSPGSGKTWFILEPTLLQLAEKGFSMLVLDMKFDVLSRQAYALFMKFRSRYPATAKFYCINFTDLSRSHRCNLIEPSTLLYLSDAIGVSSTILLSMNKTWVDQQGSFFIESPINFLAALIWWLRKYKNGIYCTLPHAIELAQTPYDKLFTLLGAEPELQTLVNPFIEAYRDKTMEMLGGQLASAKIPLGRLASPDLYYILTGNDLSLDINDPEAPKILCLGGDLARQDALAPILSLYIDRVNKLINRPDQYPCAELLDEFASVRAASVLNTIAVGRSHNIIPFLVVQDLSQLRVKYSRAEADMVLNMTGNLICGQVGGETGRWVSERFPAILGYKKSVSVNSSDTSISKSEQSVAAITPATIANLSSGEFVGILADEPGNAMELKAFHGKVEKDEGSFNKGPLPIVRAVDDVMIQENFQRVRREVEGIVNEEVRRIAGDPGLKEKVVKR